MTPAWQVFLVCGVCFSLFATFAAPGRHRRAAVACWWAAASSTVAVIVGRMLA